MAKPAVFLDRDGVINLDHGYVHTIDDFDFVEGVFEACRALKQMGYLLVVVTNQAGIAKGLYSEDEFLQLTEWMDWNFLDKDVELDGIYYCPHHPTEGKGKYLQSCACRKPEPGMLLDAAKELSIDLTASVMVGDKTADMQAAKTAGVGTRILVESGKPVTDDGRALADHVVKDISKVVAVLS